MFGCLVFTWMQFPLGYIVEQFRTEVPKIIVLFLNVGWLLLSFHWYTSYILWKWFDTFLFKYKTREIICFKVIYDLFLKPFHIQPYHRHKEFSVIMPQFFPLYMPSFLHYIQKRQQCQSFPEFCSELPPSFS